MTYVVRKRDEKETAKLVHYYYDPETREHIDPEDDGSPPMIDNPDYDKGLEAGGAVPPREIEAPSIKCWIGKFRGRDNRYMNDLQHKSDKRGTTHHRTGTVLREKVCRGVVWLEGIEKDDGTAINKVTKAVYEDYLEEDLIDFLVIEINKHNNLGPDEDRDLEEEVDLAADPEE